MDNTRKTEVVVGLVSIIGIILLVGGILLGEGFAYNPTTKVINLRLDHSGGLEAGSPVVINGVKRGEVSSVATDNGSVLAELELDNVEDLRADATGTVTILEITGGRKVEIHVGTEDGPYDLSKEMQGRTAMDLSALVTLVGDISYDLVKLLRRVDTIAAAITDVMADTAFSSNVKSMASDGAVLIKDTKEWMQQNRDDLSVSVKELRATLTDIREAIDKNEPKLTATLDKVDARLTELEGTLAKADQAILSVDSLAVNVNGIVTDIKTNEGLANALLYSESYKKSLDTLKWRLERFIDAARVNGVKVNVCIGHK